MSSVRAEARAAVVALVEAYREVANIKLTMYPGRPTSLLPPHGFIDKISEAADYPAGIYPRRVVLVELVVVHGRFDTKEAVTQADAFADGFVDWVTAHRSAAGANRDFGSVSVDDEPDWVNDWMPPEKQGTFYATRVTLEVRDPG